MKDRKCAAGSLRVVDQVARLLQKTLDEEGETDKLLTSIAESMVNPQAEMAAD